MRFAYLAIILVLFSCKQKGEMAMKASSSSLAPMDYAMDAKSKSEKETSDTDAAAAPSIQTERKLIKNGSLIFKVDDLKEAKLQLDKLIKEANGYSIQL
jgi:hypothetical protein